MGDKSSGEGPPPPSPLTGAYLLVVLPQTHQLQHKDYVIHNLTKGLLTWDKTDCHVDLEKELQTITAQAPEGEEAKNGERLIQFASENLVTEVLIHPQLNTLVQCMRNLLSSFTRHRHIIHAGYTCAGNGAWMLQDGTYSYADFAEMYQEHEVQRVLRAYENTVSVDVHCLQEGDWNNLKGKDPFSKVSRVRLNPKDCVTSTPAIKGFLDYLSPYVTNGSIDELLESSDVVGNIRFSHPTLYVFPGGQGDAALFGINGFNMLVDGGFARKACFWDFSRHLDRLDAVLMTRINNGNIQGMTSLLQRKRMDHVYPQIGHFFCNMQERRHPMSPDGDKDGDPLLVSLFDQGQDILGSLRHLQLKPQPCYRDPVLEPVNLYHKVGHGKLDMYVISPAKDSREVRDFMAKWTIQDSKIFCSFTKRGGEFNFPLCNKVSICALLVWQPANPEDNITRLLFPGSTPQHKIFEGLDKLKNLEFMKHAVCSARTLSPSSSSVGLNVRTVSKPKVPASVDKIIENDEKKIEAVKQPIMKPLIGQTEKQPPKSQPPPRPPSKQKPAEKPKEKPKTEVEVKTEKTETAKTEKAKPDKIEKTEAVQKIDKSKEKPKRPITKQPEKKKPIGGEKKDSLKSSPTTPKKIAENKVSEAQPKPEIKSRASSKTKPSPSATPAKSTKEANNRKVFEQKKEATKRIPPPKKEDTKKAERHMAPRKSVPSPSKTDKQQVSPVKGPRPVIKPKQDAKKIIKAEKDVVTESVVSTPSTVDVELAKAKEDLAEKETKVEEIKAAEAAETAEQPSLSKDEEDEILVIEKIEIEGDGKGKREESIAVHIRNSREDIIADEEAVKDEANVDLPSDEKKEIMKTSDITIPDTDSKQFSEDVQDITKDAPDTSKSRVEFMTTEEASITKEPATDKLTPKEKDGKEKSTDIGDIKQTDESQPDEKFSTTVESGATTAPTLPEDERIPLDEIKEIIEEKYIKEETKEKDIGVAHRPEQPTSLPEVPVISSTPFDQRVQLLKDIVKTPDEVADLPVHEEADGGIFAVDETQLARDLQKSRDDLLGIPAPKKAAEKKEDAAEEVKLVKDENEKEDATKDLKEDDIALDEKAAPSAVPPVEIIDQLEVYEGETQKPDDIEPAPEKEEVDLIDNEAVKSSAIPASLEDEEILEEDKDKETEKEKLLPKECRDLDKDEDVADKANKEMINEKQVAKSVVEEEFKGKKPVPEDGSTEQDKTEAVQESDKLSLKELIESKDEQSEQPKDDSKIDHKSKSPSPEPLATVAISAKPEDKDSKSPSPLPKDDETHDVGTKPSKSPSPEPKVGEAKVVEAIVKPSKSPSPEPKIEEAKKTEAAAKASKSPSPEPKAGEAKDTEDIVKASKSPSPEPMAGESKDLEAISKAPKSPSPEPKIEEAKDVEAKIKASKSPSPEPKAGEAKDVEAIVKTSKSPSPEPTIEKAKGVDAAVKASKSPSPEPKVEEAKEVGAAVKASKSPSPEPKAGESKDVDAIVKTSKSPSPEPKIEEAKEVEAVAKASKSPSPEPKVGEAKEVEAAVKASKSPSPEPKARESKDVGAIVKTSKSPSLEQKFEEPKEVEAAVKASKSPSPEPKAGESKDVEAIVKTSKSPSPEPKIEEAKEVEAAVEASKSPSPEPKAGESKDVEAIVKTSKSPSPEPKVEEPKEVEAAVKASKSPSPEPKAGESKDVEAIVKTSKSPSPEPKIEEAKEVEAAVEASKSPSPEPKAGESKDVEAIVKTSKSPSPEPKIEEAKDVEAKIKASKSPSPEPKAGESKDVEAIVKTSKSPSPEPKIEEAKEVEAVAKASKSPSPEPKVGEAKDVEAIVEKSKSPSPEPKIEEAKEVEAAIKASKSPSPEPKAGEAKIVESIVKASKSPSPEPKIEEAKEVEGAIKASKSPSPEPKAGEAKDGEAIVKTSKSPSPEPKIEEAKEVEAAIKAYKSPSPESKDGEAKDVEAIVKTSKSPSPEPNIEEAKEVEAAIKASKSPSPEPKTEEAKDIEAVVKTSKSPSPEPKADQAEDIDVLAKSPKSTSPEAKTEAMEVEAKDVEATVKTSKSPSPEPKTEEAKEIDAVIKSPKSTLPEPEADESKDIDMMAKVPKSPSPEPKADQPKDIEALTNASITPSPEPKPSQAKDIEELTVSPKSTSPGPSGEEAKDIDALIEASKSPSPVTKADQAKDIIALAKSPKSTSPEDKAEDGKDVDELIKASKSPSPEPKVDEGKTKDDKLAEPSGKPSSVSPSPEPKAEDMKAPDSLANVSKSPSPEPKVECAENVKEVAEIIKSTSPEPKAEQLKELPTKSDAKTEGTKTEDLKANVPKSQTSEPKEEELKELEPQTKLSKSPTPEPKAEETEIEDAHAKAPISPSPETKSEDSKPKELPPQLSKSPTPEPPIQESKAVEADDKLSKSPSPQPVTKAKSLSPEPADEKSLVPEDKVSKSPSPEPIADVAKGLEPSTKVSKSPSPEPELVKPKETQKEVSISPSPEPKATSPTSEVTQSDELQTKLSKSPSPEPLTEMAKSPEPIIKDSKSPSPEPVIDGVKPADQKAATPPPEPLGYVAKSPDSQTEASKTPELTTKSPEPAKDVIETMEPKAEDSKLTEPSTEASKPSSPELKEPMKSLEPQKQQSKSPSPEPSVEIPKSPQPDELSIQPQQKGEISKSTEPHAIISKSITPEPQSDVAETQEASVKASSILGSQPDVSKSPSPEPQAKDTKSPSPLPLESVDEKHIIKAVGADDILTDLREDASGKKVKTKEELNQELMEEKEVDEVSEPEKKDQKNLQTKLDGEESFKITHESKIDSFADSKAESLKLEAEKHDKETHLEQDSGTKHDVSAQIEQISGTPKATEKMESASASLEKQVIDVNKMDQSSTKKFEEFKVKEDEKSLEKLSVESELVSDGLNTSIFKTDDRVPSISLREASIEQTSEESAPHKLAEIDKASGDLERDIASTSLDRKPSSGEVSTKSTDGDGKSISEEDRKLSDTGSIGSEKSGEASPKETIKAEGKIDIVEEAISSIESSVDEASTVKDGIREETEDKSGHTDSYQDKVEKLEKSIAGDREKLRELMRANEESKVSTQLELDRSESSAQAKLDENISESSKKDAEVEEIKREHSLPESIKLEAEKDSVEVRSKDDLKDEALVCDLDLSEKHKEVHSTVCSIEDARKPYETSENDLKETGSKPSLSETSLVSDAKPIDDQLKSVRCTIDKTMESTSSETSEQKPHKDALQSSLIASESSTTDTVAESLQLKSASLEIADTGKKEEKKDSAFEEPVQADATSDKLEKPLEESKSDKIEPATVDKRPETKGGDHDAEKLSTKSPSPPTVLDMVTKEDGKISPEVKTEDRDDIQQTKSVVSMVSSVEIKDGKEAASKSHESVSIEKSPVMDKKIDSLAKADQELKSTSSTPEPPTEEASHGKTTVSSDVVKVEESKVEAVTVEKKLELTNESLPVVKDDAVSSEKELIKEEVSIVTSDKFKSDVTTTDHVSVESDEAAGNESDEISDISSSFLTVAAAGDAKDSQHERDTKPSATCGLTEEKKVESKLSKVDIDASHSSSTTASIESTKIVDGKDVVEDASLEKSSQETTITKTEKLEEIKETAPLTKTKAKTDVKDISSEPSDIASKDVLGSTAAVKEQLQFATSTVDSKQTLESIELLVAEESKTVTVTAKSITEKDSGEITTAIVTKTEEPSPASKSLADENLVVKSSIESLGSTKDSIVHSTDADFSLLPNGKPASDIIHEIDEKAVKDTAGGKEHDLKKGDIRVTDILDTAERIVSSLNGKNTISDEPSDYIPSFSETKSYTLTIEGKRGPSDETTVETKTIEVGEVIHTEIHAGKEEDVSAVSNAADVSVKDAERKSTEDMNGHSKLDKEDEHKLETTTTSGEVKLSLKESDVALSSASKSETLEKTLAQSQISTSSVEKTEESLSKSIAPKEDSAARTCEKAETEKLEESSGAVGQSLTKAISETATKIGETVSTISSFLPSDLLKSSTSSTKGSTTASPDLSRKSDDPTSTAQQDGAKGISGSKLDLASKESLIDVTSSFLSIESGVSQDSEKSMDISVSSSKSGEKVTETTDKKSSVSSTQVEPPTEKDQPLLHSTTAALRTQKEFSRSETPASDILSDREVEIGHCTPYSDTSSGQVSRAATHVWETVEGRPESRNYDSDEDIPGSPMSISSHIPSPPQFEYDMSRPQDPMMMSSFYGSLPGDFEEGVKTLSGELASAYDYAIHDKGDVSLKKELGGDKLSASIRSSLTSTPESSPLPERRFESLLATSSKEPSTAQQVVPLPAQPPSVLPSSSSLPPKPDPIEKWDKPLGLPPPHSTDSSTPYLRWNPYKEWGKPLGLPSPAPPPREDTDVEVDTSGSARTTPKKVSKMNAENNKYSSNAVKEASNKSKRSESPVKKATGKDSRKSGPTPVYMDLSYVPHHGNSNYATVEFFKRVRARYYVFSGTEPSKEVFNALLEAKQSWEDKDLEVTIIPTYDTDTLGYWIAENEETLSKLKIDLSPSASRCTINLQDHDTSCSAYRLEF